MPPQAISTARPRLTYTKPPIHVVSRPTFTSLGKDVPFRMYNEVYERWQESRYREALKIPFATHSPALFDIYLSETALCLTFERDDVVAFLSRSLQTCWEDEDSRRYVMSLWYQMGHSKREELVLKVFENNCRQSESSIWLRDECPELTLEWATGFDKAGTGNWIKLWQEQGQSEAEKEISEVGGEILPYRNLRNETWDRVNGFSENEQGLTPLRKSVRSFIHSGMGMRNRHLRCFILDMFKVLLGEDLQPTRRRVPKSEPFEDPQLAALLANYPEINGKVVCDGAAPSTCANCHRGKFRSGVLYCSSCKKINRTVMYCSEACQAEHWRLSHRRVCGKTYTSSVAMPSLSSSSDLSIESLSKSISLNKDTTNLAGSNHWKDFIRGNLLLNEDLWWYEIRGIPDELDPRKDPASYPTVLLYGNSRTTLRRTLRAIALDFLSDQEDNERSFNLATVLIRVLQLATGEDDFYARWLGKIAGHGQGDKTLDRFVKQEFPERLAKGLEIVEHDAEFRVVRNFLRSPDFRTYADQYTQSVFSMDRIAKDLDNHPEAIWFTAHPAHPGLTVVQVPFKIAGPVLPRNAKSKFANRGNTLVLVEALRRYTVRTFEQVADVDKSNMDSIGILLLALTAGTGERARGWFFWRTSLDLNLSEGRLKQEMERTSRRIERRQLKDWEILEEALRVIAEQKSYNDDDFPLSTVGGITGKKLRNRKKNIKKKERQKGKKAVNEDIKIEDAIAE
ncbi:hypothetical protein JCM3765_006009 [Sporobolomyces pararoseus]